MSQTITFLGASTGCGLFALKHALAAGHTCIALCRTPSKLDVHFPTRPANLIVRAGNAHNLDDVAASLVVPPTLTTDISSAPRLVDSVYFTIGGLFNPAKFTIDDPDVCKRGISVLYQALAQIRSSSPGTRGRPLIVVGSTTGISRHRRDVPVLFLPMYHILLPVPHADKKVMEQTVVDGPERFVIVRPSFLVDGENAKRKIRVGVEDPVKGVEEYEIGYTISREDVGRWVFEKLLNGEQDGKPNQYEGKAVAISW